MEKNRRKKGRERRMEKNRRKKGREGKERGEGRGQRMGVERGKSGQ